MSKIYKENQNNIILNNLVSENCLGFGRNPKLNNRKITHYLSGTRQKVDIFNLYEMRYLLLKVYPLIHNLFLQQRINLKKKKKRTFEKIADFEKNLKKLPEHFQNWEDFRNFKNKFHKPLRGAVRPLLPKVLFATTTELYSSIVISAAKKCHMPFHVKRWLSGTITAGASYLDDFEKWSFLANDSDKNVYNEIQTKFFQNKKNITQQAKKMKKYQLGRKPSLIIIPDVSNNEMIIKETNVFGIPVLGLVSSNCQNEISYPIFANDLSIYSIHFFCHFLSVLITKEIVKNKHKFYLTPKRKNTIKFPQALNEIFRFNKRVMKMKMKTPHEKLISPPYVFKGHYFLNNFFKPRYQIKKKNYQKLKYTRNSPVKRRKINSPKNLVFLENQKRFGIKKKKFFFKKRILPKIKLIQKIHPFRFSKILREIRIPANKPKFRFWKQNRFYFSNTLRLVANTSEAFQLKRYKLKKWNRLKPWRKENYQRLLSNRNKRYYRNQRNKRNARKNDKKNTTPYRKKLSFQNKLLNQKNVSKNRWKEVIKKVNVKNIKKKSK